MPLRVSLQVFFITAIVASFCAAGSVFAAGGGGGGEGYSPSSGFNMSIDGRNTSVSGVSRNPDGTWSGTFSSSDGRFSGLNGQTSMYSNTLGGWVTNPPNYTGGPNTWGSSAGSSTPPPGPTDSGNVTVTQACYDNTRMTAYITADPYSSSFRLDPDASLYVDGVNYGRIQNGQTKTVVVNHNQGHSGYIYPVTGCNYGSYDHPDWCQEYRTTSYFSFTSTNCTPPAAPTATLYVMNASISDATWTGENIAIDPGDQISLYWTSTNANSCTSSNFTSSGATSGTQSSVTEPGVNSATTYQITCTNSTGGVAYDSLTVNTRPYDLPTANLLVRNLTTGGGWSNIITIDPGDEVQMYWSSTNASTCVGAGFSTGSGDPVSGTQSTVDEPGVGEIGDYGLGCAGPGGTASDAVTVNVNYYEPPTVTLEVKNDTDDTSWTTSNITVDPIDDISLRWSSENATSCTGNNFSTGSGSPQDGTQSTVDEPGAGDTTTYTVVCTGLGGSAAGSLNVTADTGSDVSLTADPTYVRADDETTLSWDTGTNDPSTCTLIGPGLSLSSLSDITGATSPTITGESTYILTCPGGNDTATVQVLPEVQET